MKKLKHLALSIIIMLSCILFSIIPIVADGEKKREPIKTNSASFTDRDSAEKSIGSYYDGPLKEGDGFVTKSAIQEGLDYAKKMSSGGGSKVVPTEIWTIVKVETVAPFGVIKGQFKEKIAAGVTKVKKIDFNFGVQTGDIIKSFKLSVGFTWSSSASFAGPSSTEIIIPGNPNIYSTHRYYSALGSGTLTRYTYEVRNTTGRLLRTEKVVLVTNGATSIYGQSAHLNPNNYRIDIKGAKTGTVKHWEESVWKKAVNGTVNPQNYVYY